MSNLILAFKKSISWILVLVSAIGSAFTGTIDAISDKIEMVENYVFSLDLGFSLSQGIATDGEYFYGFGAIKPLSYNGLCKIDADTGRIVDRNEMCIPLELMKKGYCHLGDGCYLDGKLYVACEDRKFEAPAILIYDAETLDYLDYMLIPEEVKGDGHLPWCTISDGILYFTPFDDVTQIFMLDVADDLSYLGALPLTQTLQNVQGGDVYEGTVYLTSDDGKREKPIYTVDLADGATQLYCMRKMGNKFSEAEGMTVYPFADGTLFHFVDVTLSVHIRSYKVIADAVEDILQQAA